MTGWCRVWGLGFGALGQPQALQGLPLGARGQAGGKWGECQGDLVVLDLESRVWGHGLPQEAWKQAGAEVGEMPA